MSLSLTKRELAFRAKARRFTKDRIAPIAEKVESQDYFPREILTQMGKENLLGAPFPKEDGGLGLGWTFEAIVAEEVSAVSAATEMARLASAALYSAPLAYFGNRNQKKEYLAPVLAGEKVGALALTEPEAGSDAASIKTYAKTSGSDYVLNGEKRFITNGGVADYLFLFAKTKSAKPEESAISAFVVSRDSRGMSLEKNYSLLGMHGAKVGHLKFRNVQVPRENLVGRLNRGFTILLDELDRERPAVAAGMLGIARAAFESAVEYSTRRSQFGKPIRSFQGVNFKIADMAAKLEASRLLILQAARALDSGKPIRKQGAIAKLFATEAAFQIAHEALQVYGGIGYTKDAPVERYFRDARFMMIGGGTSEIMRHIIQREVYRETAE